jgi:hypothetical protein
MTSPLFLITRKQFIIAFLFHSLGFRRAAAAAAPQHHTPWEAIPNTTPRAPPLCDTTPYTHTTVGTQSILRSFHNVN